MAQKYIPLSNGFTLVALIGCIVFGLYTIYGKLPVDWGFTLTFMCIVFLIASMLSIMPPKEELKLPKK